MTAGGDVVEFVLRSVVAEQECLNVFHYVLTDGTFPEIPDLAQAFIDQVLPSIITLTPSDVFFETLSTRILFDTASPLISVIAADSGSDASILPTFNAFNFIFNVAENTTRPGHKRFAGPYEEGQADGIITNSTLIANLGAAADAMAGALVDTTLGLVDWALPIIVKRIKDGDSYRMPESVGELVVNLVLDVAFSLLITSQTSRKQRSA